MAQAAEKEKNTKVFRDCDDWEERFKELLPEIEEVPEDWYQVEEELNKTMMVWKFEPNNNQLAVAMASAYSLVTMREKRQLWTYPAGMGKSRIMVALILAVFKKAKKGKKMMCVFHNEATLMQDKSVYDLLKHILRRSQVTIETVVGLELAIAKADSKTLLLLDEADHHLLDSADSITTNLCQKSFYGIIGLSATFPNGMTTEFDELERDFNFKVLDSLVEPEDYSSFYGNLTLSEFLQRNAKRAKLIYADKDQISEVVLVNKSMNPERSISVDEKDSSKLRKLTSKDLLVVTDILLMRGLDYRSETGIDLLLAKEITNQRHRHQAYGRVGRCDDIGDRFELPKNKIGLSEAIKH